MKPTASITLISAAAVAAFIGLRSMPDTECAFLHYDAPQIDADGIQYCGEDETPTFLNLSRLRFPLDMEVKLDGTPTQGQPLAVSLSFASSSGTDIFPHEMAVSHTEKLHLLVIDPTLDDYHHLHPVPDATSGQWNFSFTPQRSGTYTLFAEFVLARTQQQLVAVGEINVAPSEQAQVALVQPRTDAVSVSGYTARLDIQPEQPGVSRECKFILSMQGDDGQPVELEPVMGAYAHMVAFDEDRDGYAHLHPKYTGKEKDAQPELAFTMLTDKPGTYRLWAQVKLAGVERFYPFELRIE